MNLPSCPNDAVDVHVIQRIVEEHNQTRGALIAVLEDIQAEYGYLPETALRTVAEATGRSLVDIYGVATFYRSFSLQPRGKSLISVCLGTACHVRGAPMVVEEFERQLGIRVGETTSDMAFSLETVNCLGACALGPIVAVDGHYFSKVDPAKVKSIIRKARLGLSPVEESVA
ncbi:MAG: NAD(P)H-dependent oxidoreductase subunit E [Candidatus Omnitrophota bacterium]|nr:MAG: NAD(P)H-dependent oxidoreductase subunit E [Candidatus Omnitrophota bacterium]